MRPVFIVLALLACFCMTIACTPNPLDAGELSPVQKCGPIQKCPVPNAVQKGCVQKGVCAISVGIACPIPIPVLTPPVYKQTLCSRIKRNREFRRIGRLRVQVGGVGVYVGGCCPR